MKTWLRSLGVYVLGVATIPAVLLIGTVTSKNLWSRPPAPKFVDFKAAQADELAPCAKAADEIHLVNFDSRIVSRASDTFADAAPPTQREPLLKRNTGLTFDDVADEPLLLADNAPRNGGTKPALRTSSNDDLELRLEDPLAAPARVVSKRDAAPLPNDGIDSLAEQTVTDEQKAKLTTLRDKLGELIKAKAELINEQTLTNEISVIEKQISDLHAAQKLLNAQQILKQMIEEFPESPAAQKAQRMLDAAGVPKSSASKLEPIPEPQRVSAIESF